MLRTGAKRMISTTTQVYPPIPPAMSHANMAAARRGFASVRWVPTIFALVSIGYGITAYRSNQIDKYLGRSAEMERQDRERRRQQALLMDAYGDKTSLADLEKAMATYESQRSQ